MIHHSVLLHEAIEGLDISPKDVVVDATLGSGGHSQAMLEKQSDIAIIGIDLDQAAILRSKDRLNNDSRVTFVNDSYRNLESILESLSLSTVNKVLFDFGFSSDSGLKSRETRRCRVEMESFVRGREHGYTSGKNHGK